MWVFHMWILGFFVRLYLYIDKSVAATASASLSSLDYHAHDLEVYYVGMYGCLPSCGAFFSKVFGNLYCSLDFSIALHKPWRAGHVSKSPVSCKVILKLKAGNCSPLSLCRNSVSRELSFQLCNYHWWYKRTQHIDLLSTDIVSGKTEISIRPDKKLNIIKQLVYYCRYG